MRSFNSKTLVKVALVAAIYVVLTYLLAPISYGYIQFRLSELLVLLAFIDPLYIPGLVLGCVIANFYSPLGVVDVVIGSLATLIAVILVSRSKKLWQACLWPVLINGVFIGAELFFLKIVPVEMSLFASMLYVALGELGVVGLIGYPVFYAIGKNKTMMAKLKIGK